MEIKCNKSKSLDWFVNGGGTISFLIRDLRSFMLSQRLLSKKSLAKYPEVTFQLAK